MFTECKTAPAGMRGSPSSLPRAFRRKSIGRSAPGFPWGRGFRNHMKKLGILVAIALLVWVLIKVRDRMVRSVDVTEKALAVEKALNVPMLAEEKELDRLAAKATADSRAVNESTDRTPFHLLATTPAGRFVKISGPLTFHAKDPIHLTLEIQPDLIADDMPTLPGTPAAKARPDLRIPNISFEVTSDRDGAARPVPFRASCSPAPEPSDISVDLEFGANHDALDAASKKINAQQLSGAIDSGEALSRLAALHEGYVPNSKGTYQIRAVYRNGRLVTAPVTVIITD